MKCLKIVTIVFLGINFASCGGDSSKSSANSCGGTNISDKSITYQTQAHGVVTVNLLSDCTYNVPECGELGAWKPTGTNQARFIPTMTSCGDTQPFTCDYTISGQVIGFTCH